MLAKLCKLVEVTLPPLTVQEKLPLPFCAEKVACWPVVIAEGFTLQVTGRLTGQLALAWAWALACAWAWALP